MGPATAFKLLIENKNIEGVLRKIKNDNMNPRKKKPFMVPDDYNYQQARELFMNPKVVHDKKELESLIVFDKCNEKELRNFLVYSKGFGE